MPSKKVIRLVNIWQWTHKELSHAPTRGHFYCYTIFIPNEATPVITQENRDFVNFLFDKLLTETDTDMIDLHDDDTAGIDAFEFQQLSLL